jgi:hypothetical protein
MDKLVKFNVHDLELSLEGNDIFIRFEVFTALTMKNAVFWDLAPCRSCVNRRFGGMLVQTRSTWRHIPEDGILQRHLCF